MHNAYNVGLIGFGMAGKTFHAPVVSAVPGFVLKVIRTASPENAALAKSLYPEVTIESDTEKVINHPSIDLVVIATPNSSHYEIARKALEAGKHVVVDKPFTITEREAAELISISEEKGKLLSVYHNRRFDSDFLTVKKILENGMLGNLVEYEARFERYRPVLKNGAWKEEDLPGSGILYDLGSHLIDQALTLFGMPLEVMADLRIQRENAKATDSFLLILNYPGLRVTLKGGMLVREPNPRYVLSGDAGSFIKYGFDVQEEDLKKGIRPGSSGWGMEGENLWGLLNTTMDGEEITKMIKSEPGDYTLFYKNIYNVLEGRSSLIVKPLQALNVIHIIELAMLSNQKRCALKLS